MWRILSLICTSAIIEAVSGEIFSFDYVVKPQQTNAPPDPVFENFGMAPGGEFSLSASKQASLETTAYECPVYALLLSKDQWENSYRRIIVAIGEEYEINEAQNPLNYPKDVLCAHPAVARWEISDEGLNVTYSIERTDQYTLQLARCSAICGPDTVAEPFNIEGVATVLNIDQNGELTQHLAINHVGNVAVYFFVLVLYLLFLVLWCAECYCTECHVNVVHSTFTVMIIFKTLEVGLNAMEMSYANESGVFNDTTEAAVRVVYSLGVTVFLASMLILTTIGADANPENWHLREKRIIGYIVVIHGVVGVVRSTCSAEESTVCAVHNVLEYIIRSLTYLVIIVAANFVITRHRSMIHEGLWDREMPHRYASKNTFVVFRFVYIASLLLPTFLTTIEATVISWRFSWFAVFLNEFGVLSIYAAILALFRPRPAGYYSSIYSNLSQYRRVHNVD